MLANIKFILIAVGAFILIGMCALLYRKGYTTGKDEVKQAYAIEFAKADKAYRAKEKEHEKVVMEMRVEFAKRDAAEAAKDRIVTDDLRLGLKRMRTRVTNCTKPSATGTTTVGADDPSYAELAPEVATELYAIAAYGDQEIRKLIALQAWAREAVKLCNGSVAK